MLYIWFSLPESLFTNTRGTRKLDKRGASTSRGWWWTTSRASRPSTSPATSLPSASSVSWSAASPGADYYCDRQYLLKALPFFKTTKVYFSSLQNSQAFSFNCWNHIGKIKRSSIMLPEEFHNILYKLASYSGSLVAPTVGVFSLAFSTSKRRKYVKAFVKELRSLYKH